MIKKDIRVNGEFYVCPVFNQAILDSKAIRTFNIEKMCFNTYSEYKKLLN